jgi:hypothetical protein
MDLSGYPNWIPIGSDGSGSIFSGTFDGNGYVIKNLTSNRNDGGLFRMLASGAIVKNLGVEDINITCGIQACGGITANMGSGNNLIENSYTTGIIVGNNNAIIGGIVGSIGFDSIVRNSYSTVSVSVSGVFSSRAGGIVGDYGGTYNGVISNVVAINANIQGGSRGRIIARTAFGTLSNNLALAGLPAVAGDNTTEKTDAELRQEATYRAIGWDMDNVWYIPIDEYGISGYPRLR